MVILGIDLSVTSTGFSVVAFKKKKKGEVLEVGKITTKPKDFDCEDDRFNYIANKIRRIIEDSKKGEKINLVAIENQFISGRTAVIMSLRKLMGMVIRMLTEEMNLKVVYIAPTTVKKAITGSGRAKKGEVAEKIMEDYLDIGEYSDKQGKKKTSDIYDAIGIAVAVGKDLIND